MGVALSHTPYRPVIIDQTDGTPPAMGGRTTTIHTAGEKMLTALGVWQNLTTAPTPITAIRVAAGPAATGLKARQRPAFDLEWDHGDRPMGYVVDNADLFAALATLIKQRNIRQLTNHRTTSIDTAGPATVQIEGADLTQMTCDLVVGCDGGRSPIRTAAGLRQITESRLPGHRDQTAIVAIMRAEHDHNNAAFQRFLPGGPIALMPLAGRLLSLVWTLPTADADRLLAADDDSFNSACSAAFGPALGFLALDGPRLKWPLHPAVTPKITAPRLALAGDAAHALHPLAGQGYNLALADAAVLADALTSAARRGLPAGHGTVLNSYASGRRAEMIAMSSLTSGLNLMFANVPSRAASLLGGGMGLLNATPLKSVFSKIAEGGQLATASLLRGDLPR